MNRQEISSFKHLYFVGVGGIGMSALVRYFRSLGRHVMGYDKTPTELTAALIAEGVEINFKDEVTAVEKDLDKGDTLVIYTPAIKELGILDDFKSRGFSILKRAEVLGMITKESECIAVAGTHGKTSVSALIAHLCKEADLSFFSFFGGISENYASNFLYNGSEISVIEADEYDRSFLKLSPDWACITSVDADHLDIYGDESALKRAFVDFASLVPREEQIFVRKGIEIGRKAKTYALNEKADYYSDNLRIVGGKVLFDFHTPRELIPDLEWGIMGIHAVENATLALAICVEKGIDFYTLKRGIARFKGVKRRGNRFNFPDGRVYIDDYAHHPRELDAMIASIRLFYPGKKLLIVFQPHLFSRTRDFSGEFAKSLSKADELILLDIYPAREKPLEGITAQWLCDQVDLASKEVSSLGEVLERLKAKEYDVLLTAGAGSIGTLYEKIING